MTEEDRRAWHDWANRVTAEAWRKACLVTAGAARFAVYEKEVQKARQEAVRGWPRVPTATPGGTALAQISEPGA